MMHKSRQRKDIVIQHQFGLHARPAAVFAKVASKYDCEVTVERNGVKVSGKSVMGLMSLEAGAGSTLSVEADGHDAAACLTDLEALVNNDFVPHDAKR